MAEMDNFMTQVANNVPMVGSFVLACIQHKINISLIPIWGRSLWPDFKLMRGENFPSQEKPLIFSSHSQLILDSWLIKGMNMAAILARLWLYVVQAADDICNLWPPDSTGTMNEVNCINLDDINGIERSARFQSF